jgi:triacylglycerol lipase
MLNNPGRRAATARTPLAVAMVVFLLGAAGCSSSGAAVPVPSAETRGGSISSPAPSAAGPSAPSAPSLATSPAGAPVPFADVGLSGVNDPTCSSEHRPVVLLHGTLATAQGDFSVLAPALRATGRCVFTLDYGMGGVRSVRSSAKTVTAFIDGVLETTGAEQVDVIGYSQGGLVLRTALRLEGLAPRVGVAVLIAPTFHGSTSPLLTALPPALCPACADQAAGSALLQELDAGGDLDGDVRYAVISSNLDMIVTPVSSQAPVGPADRVTSLIVQDRCPDSRLDHLGLRADPGVVSWVVQALDSGGSPDPSAFTCG